MSERRFALVVTSHRGDLYLPETLAIAREMLPWDRIEWKVLVDDAGDTSCGDQFDAISWSGARTGLAQAVQRGWNYCLDADFTHVFHLEEDFHLLEPVDLDAMADVLDEFGNVAQITLKRQPWSPEEQRAKGIVEMDPQAYVEVAFPHEWTQHRRCFSLNPSLIPARIVRQGWPQGNEAEQTQRLVEAGQVFGFWGRKYDPPRCLHVGSQGGMGSQGWAA